MSELWGDQNLPFPTVL